MAKKVFISEKQFNKLQNIIKEEEDRRTTVSITPPLDGNKSINPSTPIPDAQVKDAVNDLKKNPAMKGQVDKGKINIQPIGKMSPTAEKYVKDTLGLTQSFSNNNANENRIFTKKMVEESRIYKIFNEGQYFSKQEFDKFILN